MNLDKIESLSQEDVALIFLASVPAGFFGPAQAQKGLFLLSRNVPDIFEKPFDFKPESYGPYSSEVYQALDDLIERKLIRMIHEGNHYGREYVATPAGLKRAQELVTALSERNLDYITRTATWVLEQSFTSLIASVVRAYPDMGTNLIFRDRT